MLIAIFDQKLLLFRHGLRIRLMVEEIMKKN